MSNSDILLIDKYRPTCFEELTHNYEVTDKLKNLVDCNNIPHIILYGQTESGKKTFINLFLKCKYGNGVMNLKENNLEISNNKVSFTYFTSKYHFYLQMKDYNVYDRAIIQTFIKDISKTKNLFNHYHTIVIDKAEKLNIDAQQSLLRTMEKYVKNCRIILLVNSDYNLIEPLTSRCTQLRLKTASTEEIEKILCFINEKECFGIEKKIISQIPPVCDYKISHCINFLDFMKNEYKNSLSSDIFHIYYEFDIVKRNIDILVNMLFTEKEISFLNEANNTLNDLIIHTIDPKIVMKDIFNSILNNKKLKDAKIINNLVFITDDNYNRLGNHNKPIYHLMDYYLKCFKCINDC